MAKKKSNGGEGGGEKKKDNHEGDLNIVLKIHNHLHCEGCTTKIRRSIEQFPGVRAVDFDGDDKVKVLAAANVDVRKLRDKVERKTGKKVEIVSPQPKKDKDNKNPQTENEKPKEPPVKTVMLKVSWHCYGCGDRIQRAISSFNGVYEVYIDKEKEDQVKVTGKMDPNKLVEELRKKLKRPVEILPEKKEKASEKDKKEKDGGAGGGGAAAGGCGARIDHPVVNCYTHWYGPAGPGPGQGQWVYPCYVYPPQLFSDENPNSCSVM